MGRVSRLIILGILIFRSGIAVGATPDNHYQNKADHFFNRQQFDSCKLYYYNLVHFAHQKGDCFNEAKYWYQIAWLNLLQENYIQAFANRQLAKFCLDRDKTKRNIEATVWDDLFYGLHSFKKKDYPKAAAHLQKAIDYPGCINHRFVLLAKLYLTDWDVNNRPEKECKPKTLAFINFLKQHADTAWFGYAMAKVSLGWCYFKEINYPECIKDYQSAIATWELYKIESPEWINCYHRLLSVYVYSNQETLRNQLYQRISQKIENQKKSPELFTKFFLLKGMFFYAKNNYQEALEAYLNAAKLNNHISNSAQTEIFENVLESYFLLRNYAKAIEWVHLYPSQNTSLYYKSIIAICLLKTGNPEKSDVLIKNIEHKLSPKYIYYVKTVRVLSDHYFAIGNYTKCEFYINRALTWSLEHYGKKHTSTAHSYGRLAYINWKFSKPLHRVMENYHKQMYSLIDEPYTDDIFCLPDISRSINDHLLVYALLGKAYTFNEIAKTLKNPTRKQQYFEASVANYKLAFDVSNTYKLSLSKEDQKLVYTEFSKKYYPSLIDVLHQLYQLTGNVDFARQMFAYTEKSKSSLLLSMVRGVNAQKLKLIPENLSKKEEEIRTQTELLSRTKSEAYNQRTPDYAQINKYNMRLYELKLQQDSLFRLYKDHFPAYYNAKFNTHVIEIDSLQRCINNKQTVLQYLVGEKVLTVFLITRDEFRIFRDSIDPSFFENVKAYSQSLSSFPYENMRDSSIRSFSNLSHSLYKVLLQRSEAFLQNKSLVIIPDNILSQIPFETLVTAPPSAGRKPDYRNLAYLIRKNPISYNYSATLLALNTGNHAIYNAKLLAIAPSYQNLKIPNFINSNELATRGDSTQISTILGTFEEIKGIQDIFHGTSLKKAKATEQEFKKKAGDYDILHLAMHGIVNNDYPMFSKLVFSHSNDTAYDGLLNTYEIYNMRINASLVVLSACNSGNGKFYDGEGLISLARGFFTAGAKSVLMTLWAIADKTSTKLMGNFYEELAANQSIGTSLQKAKIRYLQNSDAMTSHPYFWAGYIVTGNSGTKFEVEKKNETVFYSILSLIIGVTAFIVWRWRKTQ